MRTYCKPLLKLIAYVWALPNTILGVLLGLPMIILGGKANIVDGVIEFHGGWAGRFFATRPRRFCFGAITIGHTILGTCQNTLATLRRHEHVHVRQYEQWGLFFLPAYGLSSLWEICHGRDGYRQNYFERQAYAVEDRLD